MSEYKVPLTRIKEIKPIPKADRLEIAYVYGWEVVVSKGQYQVGDVTLYCPIDSLLPQDLEDFLFPPDSKIKLDKHRVRQIKIRGQASQGMLINPNELIKAGFKLGDLILEDDYAEVLGITKYDPPAPKEHTGTGLLTPKKRKTENPEFKKYGGLDNFKWYPDLFKEGEEVVIEEKIHGSHVRCGMAPVQVDTFWKKIKKFFGRLPTHEWVYGSNNVQLQNKSKNHKGFYDTNIYLEVLEKYGIESKLQPGEYLHGEVYGSGVQKNYDYGCAEGERKLCVFDIRVTDKSTGVQRYLDPNERYLWLASRGLADLAVPVLYEGSWKSIDHAKALTVGNSVMVPAQKVMEGVVIRNTDYSEGRKILKLISEEYLADKTNTDFH
jgi:RNA ligase (TIGR02306 family)